jgi:hypothetical protein
LPLPRAAREGRSYGAKGETMLQLIGVLVFVLDIIAIVSILKSSADSGTKLLWIVLVILLPFLGMILYFAMGPGRRTVI